jgi:hypothetical protein
LDKVVNRKSTLHANVSSIYRKTPATLLSFDEANALVHSPAPIWSTAMLAHGFGEGTPTLGVKVACGKNKHVKVFLDKVDEEVLARVGTKASKREAEVQRIVEL